MSEGTSPPPIPLHLLRCHVSPISALSLSDDNERIYSGDASGKVVVTSTRSLRAITAWNPHKDGILGVEEWAAFVVTHARDDKLHVWRRVEELPFSARVGGSAALLVLPVPALCYSLDVNSLNFCRFSLLKLEGDLALVAVPNLIDSSTVRCFLKCKFSNPDLRKADVWSLPGCERVHAAIGQQMKKSIFSEHPGGRNTSGIIMSMYLYNSPPATASSSSSGHGPLSLLCAYENGSVVLRKYSRSDRAISVEGAGWDTIWTSKLHVDSIMAMSVSRSNDFALTVSADHIVGRFNLNVTNPLPEDGFIAYRTKHPGNGAVAIRDDGKICAIGGWDGKIRLYSTKSFKPLGTLKYHKLACQCLAFARSSNSHRTPRSQSIDEAQAEEAEDEDLTAEERLERSRWLVSGSKDSRISVWPLMTFERTS